MYFTYLRRELAGRRRQTIIVAVGMALAIALVIVVNSLSSGVKDAQASVLSSVYGVGTDITVTQKAAAPTQGQAGAGPGGGGQFDFGQDAGTSSGGTTAISQSRLSTSRGSTAFADTTLATIKSVNHVSGAAGTLELTNTSFSGTLPDRSQRPSQSQSGGTSTPPASGAAGGGSSFSVDSFSVSGLDPAADALGPLSSVTLKSGRTLAASDDGTNVAVVDATYATSKSLAVDGSITIGGTAFKIVGIVSSTSTDASTATNVYIPLDTAQKLSSMTGKITNVYVKADSSANISTIKADLQKQLPDTTVATQEDLASSVSGSLSTTASLVSNLGLWLSIGLLVAAFALAVLFTISGVSRRTREFGTLKAIGWSNWRITRQVAGESLVQGLIGGACGVALGLLATLAINIASPTLAAGVSSRTSGPFQRSGAAASAGSPGAPGASGLAGGPPGGGFGGQAKEAVTNIALHAPLSLWIILGAVALSVVGGLLAGAIGGWRAARLSPSEALRSVA